MYLSVIRYLPGGSGSSGQCRGLLRMFLLPTCSAPAVHVPPHLIRFCTKFTVSIGTVSKRHLFTSLVIVVFQSGSELSVDGQSCFSRQIFWKLVCFQLCANILGKAPFCSNICTKVHKARTMKTWFEEFGVPRRALTSPTWNTFTINWNRDLIQNQCQ